MGDITDKINKNLDTLFDIENDAIYRSLVCDKDGTIPETITIPTDIKIGALASQIEYLRKLSISLAEQIFLDQAEGEFLQYTLNNFFNSLKLSDETDAAWVSRTLASVFRAKVSNASIIYILRPYSSAEPIIEFVYEDSAYADFSYADCYITDLDQYVLPAVAEDYDSEFFTIKIILYDTSDSDLVTVYGILEVMIAAGISYYLEIRTS